MKRRALLLCLIVCLLLSCLPSAALAGNGITEFPQSTMAYMDIKFKCGCTRIGTGAMICKNGLITAGHNLLCSKHNKSASSIVFYFGYKSKNNYLYRYSGSCNFWYFCDFSDGYNSENDFGYVRFPSNVGDRTGWMGLQVYGDSDLNGAKCFIGAYKSDGSLLIYQSTMNVKGTKELTINRSEIAYGGEGGPIYILRGAGRNAAVVGVYTSHSTTQSTCTGVRLTSKLFNEMHEDLTFGK